MDTNAYLKRIEYSGSLEPNLGTLSALQAAHLTTVPFENLSIHAGQPIILEEEKLFEKIVQRRRGGFCFELNGLFAALLRRLGFEVTMLAARVAAEDGTYSAPFDHLTLMITLQEPWLADVAFGDSFRQPLRLDDREVQSQRGRDYRIDVGDQHYTLFERKLGSPWQAQYRFGLQAFQLSDFEARCRYHQTSPQSHFTQKRLCTRATADGRLTLSDERLITSTLEGDRQERSLAGAGEYQQLLDELFGIRVTGNPSVQRVRQNTKKE